MYLGKRNRYVEERDEESLYRRERKKVGVLSAREKSFF